MFLLMSTRNLLVCLVIHSVERYLCPGDVACLAGFVAVISRLVGKSNWASVIAFCLCQLGGEYVQRYQNFADFVLRARGTSLWNFG